MTTTPTGDVAPPAAQRRARPGAPRRPLPTPIRLVLGLAALVALGTLGLMLPVSAAERPLAWNEALFTATSALSVTGLGVITPATDLSLFGQLLLLLLIQIGGVGFMVVAVVVLRLLGRRIRLTDRLALSDSLGLLSPSAIVKLTTRVLVTVITIEALGAALLYLHWRDDERLSQGQLILFAVFHAVSAFCNAGFDLFAGTPGYPEGFPRDNRSLSIVASLIFFGGLGIPVIAELLAYPRERRFSLHTRITLNVVGFLLVAGAAGFFLAESGARGTISDEPLARRLLLSVFQSISARSSGFVGIAEFGNLTPASQLLMMTLMFIGGAPASMGGGITTGTFAALTISLWSFARGQADASIGGRTLAVGTMRKAGAVLTISLFVVLLATWLILMTHDTSLDAAAFEVISAFATCGLSLGFTTQLNLFGQLVICLMMFWGRLGALTIILAIAREQGRAQPVRYPEEQILIG